MFQKLFYTTISICILSLFCQTVSFAGMTAEHGNNWTYQREELSNRAQDVNDRIAEYHSMRGHVQTLIGAWQATESAIANGTETIVVNAGAAVVAAAASFASGGWLAPAAFQIFYLSYKSYTTYSLDSGKYLEAMGAAIGAMDTARANVGAAQDGGIMSIVVEEIDRQQQTDGYNKQYDENYLPYVAGHLGSEAHPVTATWLHTLVNHHNQTGPYYHDHKNPNRSNSGGRHSIAKKANFTVEDDLPENYPCRGGGCSDSHRTPYEAFMTHRKTCKD